MSRQDQVGAAAAAGVEISKDFESIEDYKRNAGLCRSSYINVDDKSVAKFSATQNRGVKRNNEPKGYQEDAMFLAQVPKGSKVNLGEYAEDMIQQNKDNEFGSTASMYHIDPKKKVIHTLNLGDSRTYLTIRNSTTRDCVTFLLTKDHDPAGIKDGVASGYIEEIPVDFDDLSNPTEIEYKVKRRNYSEDTRAILGVGAAIGDKDFPLLRKPHIATYYIPDILRHQEFNGWDEDKIKLIVTNSCDASNSCDINGDVKWACGTDQPIAQMLAKNPSTLNSNDNISISTCRFSYSDLIDNNFKPVIGGIFDGHSWREPEKEPSQVQLNCLNYMKEKIQELYQGQVHESVSQERVNKEYNELIEELGLGSSSIAGGGARVGHPTEEEGQQEEVIEDLSPEIAMKIKASEEEVKREEARREEARQREEEALIQKVIESSEEEELQKKRDRKRMYEEQLAIAAEQSQEAFAGQEIIKKLDSEQLLQEGVIESLDHLKRESEAEAKIRRDQHEAEQRAQQGILPREISPDQSQASQPSLPRIIKDSSQDGEAALKKYQEEQAERRAKALAQEEALKIKQAERMKAMMDQYSNSAPLEQVRSGSEAIPGPAQGEAASSYSAPPAPTSPQAEGSIKRKLPKPPSELNQGRLRRGLAGSQGAAAAPQQNLRTGGATLRPSTRVGRPKRSLPTPPAKPLQRSTDNSKQP